MGDLSLGKLLTMGYSWRGALTCFGGCVALPLLGSIVMLHRRSFSLIFGGPLFGILVKGIQ